MSNTVNLATPQATLTVGAPNTNGNIDGVINCGILNCTGAPGTTGPGLGTFTNLNVVEELTIQGRPMSMVGLGPSPSVAANGGNSPTLGTILGGIGMGLAGLAGMGAIYVARAQMVSAAVSATGEVVAAAETATGAAVTATSATAVIGSGVNGGIGAAEIVPAGGAAYQMPATDAIAAVQAEAQAAGEAAGLSTSQIALNVASAAGNPEIGYSAITNAPLDLVQNALTSVQALPGSVWASAAERAAPIRALMAASRIFERGFASGGFQLIENGITNPFTNTAFWNAAIVGTNDATTLTRISALQYIADFSTGARTFSNAAVSTTFQTLASLGEQINIGLLRNAAEVGRISEPAALMYARNAELAAQASQLGVNTLLMD